MTETMILCEPSYSAAIYIAGDRADASRICRKHCFDVGLCVTMESVDFIYTGGAESGIRVGLINYPRFPSSPEAIMARAKALADDLMVGLCQWSCSIVASDQTVWMSRRPSE